MKSRVNVARLRGRKQTGLSPQSHLFVWHFNSSQTIHRIEYSISLLFSLFFCGKRHLKREGWMRAWLALRRFGCILKRGARSP